MFVKDKKKTTLKMILKGCLGWTVVICPAYRLFSQDVYPLIVLGFCQKSKEIYVQLKETIVVIKYFVASRCIKKSFLQMHKDG